MVNMYEIINFLCARDGINIAQMCKDIGLRQGLISDLKHGRSKTLSTVNMQKIASYFQVSTDIFNEGVFEETLPNGADIDLLREISLKFAIKKEAPTSEGERSVSDDDIKFALFGDAEIDDELYEEVKAFARFAKERKEKRSS